MLHSLNEIDLVEFYTSSRALYPSKMSIISPVNISDTIPLNTCLPYNPAPSHQPGSYSSMFSDHWFERDLFENKMSESNILKASETLVIENHHRCGEG